MSTNVSSRSSSKYSRTWLLGDLVGGEAAHVTTSLSLSPCCCTVILAAGGEGAGSNCGYLEDCMSLQLTHCLLIGSLDGEDRGETGAGETASSSHFPPSSLLLLPKSAAESGIIAFLPLLLSLSFLLPLPLLNRSQLDDDGNEDDGRQSTARQRRHDSTYTHRGPQANRQPEFFLLLHVIIIIIIIISLESQVLCHLSALRFLLYLT